MKGKHMKQKTIPPTLAAFDELPDSSLVDARTIALLMSCSVNTVWRRAKAGIIIPAGNRISSQQTRWRVGDIREALQKMTNAR